MTGTVRDGWSSSRLSIDFLGTRHFSSTTRKHIRQEVNVPLSLSLSLLLVLLFLEHLCVLVERAADNPDNRYFPSIDGCVHGGIRAAGFTSFVQIRSVQISACEYQPNGGGRGRLLRRAHNLNFQVSRLAFIDGRQKGGYISLGSLTVGRLNRSRNASRFRCRPT